MTWIIVLSAVAGAILGIAIFVTIATIWHRRYVLNERKNFGVGFEAGSKPEGHLSIKVIRGNKS
jgi:uncharacterized membrane protein YqiK